MSHQPRKRFGQNFLHDPGVINRIVSAVSPKPGDRLVEIGPGQGAITKELLKAAGALQAIELDRDLVGPLAAACALFGELTIHLADALRFDFTALAQDAKLRVVGNLPYNISTPILFHLLEQKAVIADMHFMLQREVVERMAADPGGKDYGRLSVMLQAWCRVTHLFDIGPGAFNPPPKVHSAFVRLTPYPEPPHPIQDRNRFAQVVTAAFGQRRKTLRNALKGVLSAEQIESCGIDPGARAETLSVGDFARLANRGE
ncbi:MAG: 16S rRNA (adenine(1518)-N(6)/adenine(1519)-N(6))-dimethyltransferase [Gammaproteobacteria bacterium RIFOXYA12_FULL_61_12]|nr:MAG: 16S rRNA (adenine(1518)-N(6)/adenine(1519)-N(6))-dimethyltransferase [Gammaproteobacteria bacterium RIFOXYD12_FULL_61_37]OGT92379.1 MAG: 16S rRNA (adenine(1518)-N(6)/adenine(1519)-N(6))-dimethyltransferase [Gammaproteobacteria bacterium RIFOXYA12_FULL_61_12]